MPQEPLQLNSTQRRCNQHFDRNRDSETSIRTTPDGHNRFTSDCDLSCTTIIGSELHAVGPPEPLNKNRRFFTGWIVKLNSDNQVVVEGTLGCGRRGRTKPIAERISISKISSKFNQVYHLVGNLDDPQYELPRFVRQRFHSGFPADWEIVVGIWKRFVESGCDKELKWLARSEAVVVEKKLKPAIHECSDSYYFMEYAKKVDSMDNDAYVGGSNDSGEHVDGYCENNSQEKRISKKVMQRSVESDKPRNNQRFESIVDLKQLTAWTPIVFSNESSMHCLAFKGTLLSSMGHAVEKNHVTDAVHQRLSATVIKTTKQEFYELVGDLNNTKHDVPKELVTWCRYGCPRQINSFCEQLRILRPDKTKIVACSSFDEKRSAGQAEDQRQGQQKLSRTCPESSGSLIENSKLDPFSRLQSVRERNKRKRIVMELNDNYSINDADIRDNMTCYGRPGAIWRKKSRVKGWAEMRGKTLTNLADTFKSDSKIVEGKTVRTNKEVLATTTCDNEQQGSAMKQVPCLSYVFNRCASPTENILSDGL